MSKFAILVAVFATASSALGQVTHPAADEYNDRVYSSLSMSIADVRSFFEKSPSFDAYCVPSAENFTPLSGDMRVDGKGLWSKSSGQLTYPQKLRPLKDGHVNGVVSFVFAEVKPDGFAISADFDLKVDGKPAADINGKERRILCERDEKRNCRALVGRFSQPDIVIGDLLPPPDSTKSRYSRGNTDGVFELFQHFQYPTELIMRLGLTFKAKIETQADWPRTSWSESTDTESFPMRYICKLTPR